MAIAYSFSSVGDTLIVKASGFDESEADVESYGMAIIAEVAGGGYARVLCDESDLEYRLGVFDTHQAAAAIAQAVAEVSCDSPVVRIAIVCGVAHVEDARFWETVVVNRGLLARAFTDLDAAKSWVAESS